MSDESPTNEEMIKIPSSRFGEVVVPVSSIFDIPAGLIGFPTSKRFIMIDHKEPFSWLQSADDPNLAFVVVNGAEFGENYSVRPPLADRECDFKEEDEYAILVIVTVRSDPKMTTANLKAPVFVNMRNRRGVQIIIDDARYSTRFPLWAQEEDPNNPEQGDK